MRKKGILLLVLFFGGVLLMGLGCGIAFVEYSSLEYAGIQKVSDVVTEELTYTIATDEMPLVIDDFNYYYGSASIVYDDDMPKNEIKWKVSYNQEIMLPYLHQYSEEKEKHLYVGMHTIPGKEFDVFMREKDVFLKDLKEGKIWSYDVDYQVAIEIVMHSDLKGKVKIV